MASKYPKINPGTFAHICNRAVGNEVLFRRNEDYDNWMERVEKFIIPVAEIHAFKALTAGVTTIFIAEKEGYS